MTQTPPTTSHNNAPSHESAPSCHEGSLLEIRDLHARVGDREILRGLNLTIQPGEVHSIMGPNGSGKSTLAQVLAGRETYEVTQGQILLDGQDLQELSPDERAAAGVFLAFQYPVEIPGVTGMQFLRAALDAQRKARGQEPMDAMSMLKWVREKAKSVQLDDAMLKRAVNEDFSGGEKKRNEVFQMAVLQPRLAVLDETDSGLDIDAMRIVADGVNQLRQADRGFLIITHYQRLLDYIEPDFVHVLVQGRIVRSGDKSLALELEERGYSWANEPDAATPAHDTVKRVTP